MSPVEEVLRPADDAAICDAARVLAAGGLVGMPTETVYGLAAHARDTDAVTRLFALKQRPADNPLIVHVPDVDAVAGLTRRLPPLLEPLAEAFWPGPLTMVLEAAATVPRVTTGGGPSVAVRVPDHPVALALLERAGLPIAAPSANRSGRPSPTTARHVVAEFGDRLDLVLDGGACLIGVESTVLDVRGRRAVVLREGAVTREALHSVVGDHLDVGAVGDGRASPGTRYRHYAPSCPVEVVAPGAGPSRAALLAGEGRRVGLVAADAPPPGVVPLARVDGAAALAAMLYAVLRRAEEEHLDVLVVEGVEEVGIGRAVMDRLRRASTG